MKVDAQGKKKRAPSVKVDAQAKASSKEVNPEVWAQDKAEVHQRIDALYEKLMAQEDVIDRAAEVLRLSQPYNIAGFLDVQWWLPRGNSVVRDPTLIRWEFTRVKTMRPVRAERVRKVGTHPKFQLNAAQTMEAVAMVRMFKEQRAVLKTKIWKIKQITARLDELDRQVENAQVNLEFLMRAVGRNLLRAGYEVHPNMLRKMGLIE